jgi:CTP synthase
MVHRMESLHEPLTIALVGKYIELQDAYLSVKEALQHAGLHHERRVEMRWVQAEALEHDGGDAVLSDVHGIVVPGGFGYRGFEGMIRASRYAREHEVPYLGLCFGMQAMVVEYARSVVGPDANSSEFEIPTRHPVIDFMPDQRGLGEKGGTMRLGAYPCILRTGSKAAMAYGQDIVYERHRHRLEFNNDYRGILGERGLLISGTSPDDRLVEVVEVPDHPWMVGVQFHPELRSRPQRPHPLFRDFIGVAKQTLREGTQQPLPL